MAARLRVLEPAQKRPGQRVGGIGGAGADEGRDRFASIPLDEASVRDVSHEFGHEFRPRLPLGEALEDAGEEMTTRRASREDAPDLRDEAGGREGREARLSPEACPKIGITFLEFLKASEERRRGGRREA